MFAATSRAGKARVALAVSVATMASAIALPATAGAATTRLAPLNATATPHTAARGCHAARGAMLAGGACHWSTTLSFRIPGGTLRTAVLRVGLKGKGRGVLVVDGPRATAARVRGASGPAVLRGTVRTDVLPALTAGARTATLTVSATGAATTRLTSATLMLGFADGAQPASAGPGTAPAPGPAPAAGVPPTAPAAPTTPTAPAVPPAPVPPTPGQPSVVAPPPPSPPLPAATPATTGPAVWLGADAIRALPMAGTGWTAVKRAADSSFGPADVSDQNSDHDVSVLAAALVSVRTGTASYRSAAAAGIADAIGTEAGGRTLALGRNLASYVVAADLIDLAAHDPALDSRFRAWIAAARTEDLQGLTLISTHERRPNNWGTMAGASRVAVDLYLGDADDLARAASVFRGYLGDRSAYTGFSFGDLSFQADPAHPVGIVPAGATKDGVTLDGAIADDMRRGCSFQPVPCRTNYAWEALQGVTMQAELLSHHGYPAFSWSDDAVLRAAQYLKRLDDLYGSWWAANDDTWQPWVLNQAYGTQLPAGHGGPGKVFGWTDWVYGAGS